VVTVISRIHAWSLALAGIAGMALVAHAAGQAPQGQPPAARFSSGVELVNVNATVYDADGRFVEGLTKDDFVVYEDGVRQTVTHFSADRVPVSLGIVLDKSGSMSGDKIRAANSALNRFLSDLLDPTDQIFLYTFNDRPSLVQDWTTDRAVLSQALAAVKPGGGTALYDAVADALPVAARGAHQKKALLVISDGNDTASHTAVRELQAEIRRSEVLAYAIGIDSDHTEVRHTSATPRMPTPVPFPLPPGRFPPIAPPEPHGGWTATTVDDHVNAEALQSITDDSGGRTEIIRSARDLDPATAGIADELSRQYYLGYQPTAPQDGRWHAIRVETRNPAYHVRARKGYVAN
jgi:Ca-activated chloride channel homolog